MSKMILGFVTTGLNNWIDYIFLVLLLFHSLDLSKKGKRIIFLYFMVFMPIAAGVSYILEPIEAVRGLTYWIIALLAITLIPALAVGKEILKYEFCYILNYVGVSITSLIILGGSELLNIENLYFHADEVSLLPGFFLCNAIYIICSYAIYRLSKIIVKGYRKESKIQNALAFGYLGAMHVVAFSIYFQIYSDSTLQMQRLASIFLGIGFGSLGFLVLALYRNRQIHRENALIKRHREKEMEYYGQLEKDQLTIRRMRHDIMNYFQTVRQMSGDEDRIRELLDELESQVRGN